MLPPSEFLHEAIDNHADRIARFQKGELTAEEFRPVRLSHGLYAQLDHTSHMQRVKVTGGGLTAAPLDAIARIGERWGRGVLHVTTRQDRQVHWIPPVPLRDFLPAEDTLGYAEAVVRIQHRYGERKNRHKARLKFLVQRMGLERFRAMVEAEFDKIQREQGEELRRDLIAAVASYVLDPARRPAGGDAENRRDERYLHWLRTNTETQRQSGYRRV